MKRMFAAAFSVILFASPALALAQSAIPVGQTPLQLLTTVAAIEAQEAAIQNNESLACAALFGASSAQVGQPVALAWGSFGAVSNASSSQPTYTPEGATYVTLGKAGTWTYSFTFYGQSGAAVTCTAKIVAH